MSMLELDKESLNREPTVWDIALWLLKRYCQTKKQLIALEGKSEKKRLSELEKEAEEIAHDLEKAYRIESEAAEKRMNDTLDYFCGRHTFFPFEC